MRLLILDNYDSFTYNLVHLVEKAGDIPFSVKQHDAITLEEVNDYDKILLSPGPGLPACAGILPQLLEKYHRHKSILGICLGLQAIGELYGCTLKNLPEVCHGMATPVHIINDDPVFKNCPAHFLAGRYHSWVIDEKRVSDELLVTAVDDEGLIMAARHKKFDVRGLQFHPESILSEHGELMIRNWINS
jgi:anthranilate synthase component II